MLKRLSILLLFFLVGSAFSQGTTGRISGVVKDADTGDFLPGVNVLVEGTSMGASTDVDGFYVILNVPVGKQTLRFSYVGYSDVLVSDVVVSVDLTTELNANMATDTGSSDVVEVVAKNRLIRKEETNSTIVKTAEEIKNVPVRDVQSLIAISAGVVKQDNSTNMFTRGGRANETAIVVDGVNQNNVLTGVVTQRISRNAIEQIQVQTGGFNAEYGDVMSGLIHITQKSGSEKYEGGFEVATDAFTGGDGWGSRSYNQYFYNAFVSGPIVPNNKDLFFFANVEYQDNADRAPNYEVNDIAVKPGNDQTALSASLRMRYQLTEQTTLKFGVNITDEEHGEYSIGNFFNTENQQYQFNDAQSYTLEATHVFDKNFFIVGKASYSNVEQERGARKWMGDLLSYGDPVKNNYDNNPGSSNPYRIWPSFNAKLNPVNGRPTYAPSNGYSKNRNEKTQFSLDAVYQIDKHRIKAGFAYTGNVARLYTIAPRAMSATTFNESFGHYRDVANLRNYGYNFVGEESDTDDWSYYSKADDITDPNSSLKFGDGAKEPWSYGMYIQDQFEFGDIMLNLGLRFDAFNANTWAFKDITQTYADGEFTADDVEDSETFTSVSPRFGVSFPIDEKSKFSMNFGTFYQFPNLNILYLSRAYATERFEKNGSARSLENPNLKPSRTTSYEISYQTEVSEDIALKLNAYYRETNDLINESLVDIENTANDQVTQLSVQGNIDFGIVRGLEVAVSTNRINNFQGNATFTFSSSKATGSSDRGNSRVTWLGTEQPRSINSTSFDQPFTGNLSLDYHYGNDAPMEFLNNFGANILTTFYTGRAYTKYDSGVYTPFGSNTTIPLESAVNGARAPFVFRADLRLDKSFKILDDKINLNVYVDVRNLFNTKNELGVYPSSGRADKSGYLGTDVGKEWLANQISSNESRDVPYPLPAGMSYLQAIEFLENDPSGYGLPRQITAGLRVDF